MFDNIDLKIKKRINQLINEGNDDFTVTFDIYIGDGAIYDVCHYYKVNGYYISYLKKEYMEDFSRSVKKQHKISFHLRRK